MTLSMSDLDLNWITDTYPQDVTNTYKCLLTAQSIFATDIPGLSNIASDKYDMDATGADARALSTIQTIKFTVPENTPDASANKKIATVTSAGKIKGVKKGTTTITVKSGNITKKIKVTVK